MTNAQLAAQPRVFVFLPVYNENPGINLLLGRIAALSVGLSHALHVVAVDDGSTDGTAAVLADWAARLPLTIITHEHNRGLPQVLRSGFQALRAMTGPDDLIVTMDADDTHDPAQIPDMLQAVAGGADVVIASRYRTGAGQQGVSLVRRACSRGASVLSQLLLPMPGVRDIGCGYRLFWAGVLHRAQDMFGARLIELDQYGFVCTTEYLVKFALATPVRIVEVPFQLHYERKQAGSKMRVLKTIRGYVQMWWAYWWRWRRAA